MAALYHGVLPAFLLGGYSALALALAEVHRLGFKARELGNWSTQLQMAVATLFKEGFAAGLSSVGPLVYVILPDDDPVAVENIRAICGSLTIPDDHGRSWLECGIRSPRGELAMRPQYGKSLGFERLLNVYFFTSNPDKLLQFLRRS
jgi:hypothetical protein